MKKIYTFLLLATCFIGPSFGQSVLPAYLTHSTGTLPVGWTGGGSGVTINTTGLDACGGTSVNMAAATGYVQVNYNAAATNFSFVLNINGTNAANAKTLLVEESPDGTTWSTNSTYTQASGNGTKTGTLLAGSRYFRLRLSARSGGSFDVDAIQIYNTTPFSCYCASASTNGSNGNEYISKISSGSFSNTTTNSNYANYISNGIINTVTTGSTFTITVANANPFSTDLIYIYADWNHNGTFTDAGELAGSGSGAAASNNITVTVPAGATIGNTAIRIRLGDGSNGTAITNNPCQTFTYGETEDYIVNLIAPSSITTGTISPLTYCNGSSFAVSVPFTSLGTYTSNTYTAQLSSATGVFPGTNIGTLVSNLNSGTINATIPAGTAAGTGYRIRVISNSPAVLGSDNGANITVTALPVATFSYTASPFCQTAANPFPTFSGGGVAGTFTSTGGLVFVSASTGQINLSASTPGTYAVTNTIAAAGGCAAVVATSSVTITALPVATFSYTASPFCQTAANPFPTFSGGGVAGTFTSTGGLVFVSASTGQINLSASTPGTYTVTNTIAAAGGCAAVVATSSVTITALPVATFSYTATPYCQTAGNPSPTFNGGGVAGTFTSTGGLVFVSASTGQINLSASTPGTYTVTNTIAATGGCAAVVATSSVTITALPVATFSYTASPYCQTAANPSPTFSGGGVAGTFSSTGGLVFVSAATGQVDLSSSTPGTYTVTNTIAASAGCAIVTATSNITINQPPAITGFPNPSSQTLCATSNVSYSVAATGTGLTYQWLRSGSNISNGGRISGATSTTLTITGLTAADNGDYSVVVTGTAPCTFATSTTSTLIVDQRITFTTQPVTPQTICEGQPYTIFAQATGTVAIYQWYRNGTLLSTGTFDGVDKYTLTIPAVALADNGATYRLLLDDGTGLGCTSANSNIATLNVNATSVGGAVTSDASVCNGANSGTVNVNGQTGSIIRWEYSTDAGTTWTALSNTSNSQPYSNLIQTTLYRAIAQNGVCVSAPSTPATITVYNVLTAGTVAASQTICYNTTPAAFTSTALPTGGNGTYTYQWQSSPNGTTWTSISGATAITYAPGALTATTYYRRNETSGGSCGTVSSNVITITVYANLTAGTVAAAQTICYNTIPAAFTSTGVPSGGTGTYTYQWQSSPDNTTFTDISGATATTYAPGALTATTYYRRNATSGTCGTVSSPSVKITVNPNLIAGTVAASQTICYNTIPVAFTSTALPTGGTGSYTYQWQSSTDNVTFTNVASGGTSATYAPGALTITTYYRRQETSGTCGTVSSNVITVTVNPNLVAGTVAASQTICYNTTPAAFTSTTLPTGGTGSYTYQWQSATVLAGPYTNVASGGTGTTYAPGALTVTTYYRRNETSGTCGTVSSNVITVTVYAILTGGTVATTPQTICYNTAPSAFTNTALPTGADGTYTYQWQSSPDNVTFTNISGATGTAYTSGALTATTYFRRNATSTTCVTTASSNVITVNVRANLVAGTVAASQIICYNTAPATFTNVISPTGGTGTYTYQWQSSTDNVTFTNVASGGTSATYAPGALTITTYYRRQETSGTCGTVSSNVITVTVNPNLVAGTVAASQTICYNTTPAAFTSTTLPTGGTGSYTYQWQSATVLAGPYTNVASGGTGTTYAPGALTVTTYYRRNETSGTCGTVSSNVITVTVYAILTGGTVATTPQTICYNTAPSAFTNTALPTGADGTYTYQWQSSPDNVTFTNISGATGTAYTSGALTATTYFRRNATSTTCVTTASSNVITVNVRANLVAGTVAASQIICYNTAPATFTNVISPTGGTGTYTYQWQSSTDNITFTNVASGGTSATYAPGALTITTYYRRQETSGTCGTVSSNVLAVTVYANLTAGTVAASQTICYNTTPAAFTSTALPTGGNGTYTYQWQSSPNGTTWTSISGATAITYAPGALTATTYYRRNETSGGSCGTVSSNVITITVYANLTAGTVAAAQTICYNTIPTAFTSTGVPSGGTGTYTYQWQSSPDNTTFTDISGATATTYAPGALTATTYYRRNVTSGTCGTVSSNVITVTVYNNLIAGTVGTSQSICYNTTPAAFTSATLPTGGNGTYTYQWQSSPDNTTWTNISGATATTYAPGVLTVMTYYRRSETSGTCGTVSSNVIIISINPLPVVSITGPNPICAGFTTTLSPSTGGIWISNNTSVATVNASTGVVTGVATTTGTATFTFTITATGCVNTTPALTVNALPVVAAITDGASNICVNSITQFTDATAGGTWSITNGTGTATIDATGTVTGVTAGNVTVVYTYTNATPCTNQVTKALTIDAQPTVSPVTGGATTVCVSGQTPAFTDAPTSGGTWSIINGSGSATITTAGVVTGLSAGTVTVLYTTNNLSCTNEAGVSLTVIAAPAVTPINGGVARVCINSVTPSFMDATLGGTWGITNGSGSANINSSGIVTPVTAGTVTVTYTINNGTCSNIATAPLTIDPIPTVAAIGGGSASVCVNGITPAFNDPTSGGTWSITNGSGTASISPSGVVTGLTSGTVTVVYTITNATCSKTATTLLTVNPLPVAGAITGASTVCTGSNITLNSNATGTSTLTYTWVSSNTSFATVTNAGVVTGVSAGIPGITYTVSDGNGCAATSPNYPVTVSARPTATISSANVAICKGNSTNITGTVTATGAWTLTLSNSSIATGTGNGTFSISVNPTTNTTYTISSLTDASCASIAADLTGSTVVTVNNPPNLSTVSDVLVCNTLGASFFVNAGPGTFTYQWYKVPGTIINNTANITGATTNILHFNQAGVSDIGDYYVIVSGLAPCGSAQSNNAHLDVSGTITIGTQPASQTVCTGTNVTFTVAASTTSGNTLTYQWTKNGSNIAGATLSAYTITGATTTDAGNYAVSITDISTCPNAFSTTSVLTVNPIPTVSISGDVTVCQGGTSPNITFTNPQALPVTITYNINGTGTATINVAANSTATVAAATGTSGVFAYDLVSVAYQAAPGCTNSITGTATVTVNPTPTATISGTITVCQGSTAPNITFTNPNPLAVTITYNINGSGTTTVNVAASSTATVAALTGAGGIFNYNLVSVAYQSAPGCSTPVSGVATVTVNPTPTATISGTTTVCQSSAAPNITFTNPQALAVTITYNINGSGNTTINVGANTTATVAAPTGVAGTFIYNLTNVAYQSAPGCSTPITGSATITVKATPTVSATNTNQSGCSPKTITAISITNPNNITGATYTWTRDNTIAVTGIAASGSGNFPGPGTISGTLTNTTFSPVTVTFTITPYNGTCPGTPVTATVLVNPTPVMTSISAIEICNHATVNIPLTSTVASTYTWVAAANPRTTGESTTTQTTGTLSNTLDNNSVIRQLTPRQDVVYTVIPTSLAGCVGPSQTVTVTVNPSYNVSFYEYPSDVNSFTICDGAEVGGGNQNDIDLIEGQYAGSTLLWQYSLSNSPYNWQTMVGPYVNNANHDTLPDPPSIFSPVGSYYFRLLVDGCTSDTLSETKTSTLTISAGGPTNTICESGSPAPITLSGAAVNGTSTTTVGGVWSITSLSPLNGSNLGTLSNTGFITAASGNIPNVTYIPPANYSGTVTLTLTSNDPDGPSTYDIFGNAYNTCVGIVSTRTITINPAPVISNPSTLSICNGSNTNITLASVIPSTYQMTLGSVTGGITGASSIAGNITAINQVLTNPSSTVAGTVTYNVTPTPNSPVGCAAITTPIVVTVTPSPAINLTSSAPGVCQGTTATLTAVNSGGTLNGTVTGSNYTPVQILGTGPSTITSSFTLPAIPSGSFSAADITLNVNINHTYVGDLTMKLISPCGTATIFDQPNNGNGNNANDLYGTYTFTTTGGNTFPQNGGGLVTIIPYTSTFAGITFPCSSGAGTWTLQITDHNNLDGGYLNGWSLTINTHGVYTSVFNGNPSIGALTYTGATNTTAKSVVTPPVGTNNYTVTTTDPYGCSATSTPVPVVVNPTPTLTGATTSAVCVGLPAIVNLTGLVASSTATIAYKVNGVPQTPVTNVGADASGNASFSSVPLIFANNGQILQITGVTITSATPSCPATFTQNITLSVNPTPTLASATQASAVCPGSTATINLTGLVANSTSTITYTINSGPAQTATGVVATGTTATFTTVPLTFANNGQTLQITGITITSATPGCTAVFTTNVTLSVNPTPMLTSTLTPPAVCSGNTFGYTPTSSVNLTTFVWTRAAVAGISQPAGSGIGGISEQLTNTTSASINVIYIYTLTANGCSNAPGQSVVVSVSPSPTTSSVALTQTGSACAGTGGNFTITGLAPNFTATLYYTINNGPLFSVTVTSNAAGTATFVSTTLALSNNNQIIKITGVSGTACIKSVNIVSLISVNPVPTLTGATAAMVCPSGPATVSLSGLVPNSINNTINYKINGIAQPAVTGVNADVSGNAAFNTTVLTPANNGQTLTITGITNGTCSSTFTQNIVLSVSGSYTWLGVDNNWFNPANWCGGVPTITSNVLIPVVGTSLYPILTTGNGYANNITIQSGASVKVATGGTLTINAAITNGGIFDVTTGKIELNGSAIQTIGTGTFSSNSIMDLLVSNAAGVSLSGPLNVYGSLTYGVANGTLNTNGNLTLKSTITQTAYVGDMTNHVINGSVTVERYIATGSGSAPNHGKSWQLLAVPTTGQTIKAAWQEGATATNVASPGAGSAGNLVSGYGTMLTSDIAGSNSQPTPGFDAVTTPGPSIKYYNAATGLYAGPTSTALPVYDQRGYFVFVRGDRSVNTSTMSANPTILRTKGALFTPSNPPPITNIGLTSFASIGNPYAAPIDIRQVTKSTGVSDFFQVWDPRLGGAYNYGAFQTLSKSGADYFATPGGGSYGSGPVDYIQSGQAFFMQTAPGQTGTVSISEAAKAGSSFSGTIFARQGSSGRLSSVQSAQSILRTTLRTVNVDGSTGEVVDGVLSKFDDNYSNQVDGLDARKSANTGENLSIKTGGILLSIESKHAIIENDTIFLNLTRERVQPYQFSFDAQNLNTVAAGFVEDTYLKNRTPLNLSGNTLVNFTVANIAGSYAPDRFRIVFSPLKVLPVTFTSIKAYKQNKNINVEWKVDNERNIKQYEVEKSVNGKDFSRLAITQPTANNGSSAVYVLTDTKALTGYNYYRIRSIDINGSISYSTVVNVMIDVIKQDININPNPITDGQIHLQFMNEPAGRYGIRLLNKLGQVIMQKQIAREDGTSTEIIKWDFNLAHGMYQLEVTRPDGSLKDINVLY